MMLSVMGLFSGRSPSQSEAELSTTIPRIEVARLSSVVQAAARFQRVFEIARAYGSISTLFGLKRCPADTSIGPSIRNA
jgi:hypothetical protein